MKKAVLQWVGRTPEQHWWSFWSLKPAEVLLQHNKLWGVCYFRWGDGTRAVHISYMSQWLGGGGGHCPLLASMGIHLGDIPLEQTWDESLKHDFDQVKVIYGQRIQWEVTLTYPYFLIIKDTLYRLMQDTYTKNETTQLMVVKSRRDTFFHCNFKAEHLGQDKTLNLMV